MEVISGEGVPEDEALRLAAVAEKYSEHPLARAVSALARERALEAPYPDEFSIEAGMGVEARTGGDKALTPDKAVDVII
jgi:cation transport ATPase